MTLPPIKPDRVLPAIAVCEHMEGEAPAERRWQEVCKGMEDGEKELDHACI